ncbi:MAG: DUF480 domain-containing protein [Actinomycetia bacterium]|nr:DUF480 domain-containing protein [Actinomycetes bacterium]
MALELTVTEVRVLGALVEKERTTPDSYPLSSNALVAACNQKTSRDPVVAFTEAEVDAAMLLLREKGLARTVRGAGSRAWKHRHVLNEELTLDDHELAVLAVMMLRGPQTPGELRTRTERYVDSDSVDTIERALVRLSGRTEPLVIDLGRGPGQSQDRWVHLVGDGEPPTPAPEHQWSAPNPSSPPGATGGGSASAEIVALRSELDELRSRFDALCELLGEDPRPAPSVDDGSLEA